MTEGQKLLQDVYDYTGRFVVFPDEASHVAHTLWVAHTHLIDAFATTPRLWITAATSKCGKTTLADITELLTPRSIGMINPSPSSLFRIIKQKHPTLLIDEIQDVFAKKETYDITMIINSGFQRGKMVTRVEQAGSEFVVKEYETFGPMALTGIDTGNIPEPVLSRCIPIRLKRRLTVEPIEPFDPLSDVTARGHAIRDRLETWAKSVADKLKAAGRPVAPNQIQGRDRNKWEPLFSIADVADGTDGTDGTHGTARKGGTVCWGERIRQAALEYVESDNDEQPLDEVLLLLLHIKQIFSNEGLEFYPTKLLLEKLQKIEDAPWLDYSHGKPLSARRLGELLGRHKIGPDKSPTKDCRGYYPADFKDVFARFFPPPISHTSLVSQASKASPNTFALPSTVPTLTTITPGMTLEQYYAARGLPPPEW
jgi:Protein of unknown function (DUF3631)